MFNIELQDDTIIGTAETKVKACHYILEYATKLLENLGADKPKIDSKYPVVPIPYNNLTNEVIDSLGLALQPYLKGDADDNWEFIWFKDGQYADSMNFYVVEA